MARFQPRDAAQCGATNELAQLRLGYTGDQGGECLGGAIGDDGRVLGVGEPAARHHGKIGVAKPGRDRGWIKKVRLDKAAESGRDPILVPRNDAGVRDRQSERPLEERHDGEPVGDTANKRSLGNAAQEQCPEARLGIEERGREQQRRQQQQPGREQALPAPCAIVRLCRGL